MRRRSLGLFPRNMARDVTTDDGTLWNCVQAYAGLDAPVDATEAPAEASETPQGAPVEVVCTPRGGAQTVRLKLPGNWERSVSDAELGKAIADAQPA